MIAIRTVWWGVNRHRKIPLASKPISINILDDTTMPVSEMLRTVPLYLTGQQVCLTECW